MTSSAKFDNNPEGFCQFVRSGLILLGFSTLTIYTLSEVEPHPITRPSGRNPKRQIVIRPPPASAEKLALPLSSQAQEAAQSQAGPTPGAGRGR